MKNLRCALAGFLCAVFAAAVMTGCAATASVPELTVDALKVGKADALIFRWGGHCMLIDCGEEDDGEDIVNFLTWEGVTAVDVLIITHFDKDHVGGAPAVMRALAVDKLITPNYEGAGEAYETFRAALESTGLSAERLAAAETVTIDGLTVLMEPAPADIAAAEVDDDYDNDMSLITTVTHGDVRMLFTGDIEKARVQSWLEAGDIEPYQLIKMPHHGEYNKKTDDLLDAVKPEAAIICCSGKNPADDKTLDALAERSIEVWQTADGDIRVTSSGKSIKVTQE